MNARLAVALLLCVCAMGARAGDDADHPSDASATAAPMPQNAPMDTRMMKKGMTMGDVEKAAKARKKKMDEMMEQERKKAGM